MKKLALIISIIGAFTMFISQANAQTSNHSLTMGIPEVCLLTTPAAAIDLTLTTAIAGAAITGGTGTGYAQVSSIVSTLETRTITAAILGVPAGTSLTVATTPPVGGNSGGTLGLGSTATALVNSAAAVTLVTAIGSCYTGVLATDGYVFDYVWDAAAGSYGTIVATTGAAATVTLTITNTL